MGLLMHLIATAAGNSKRKKMENKIMDILRKYKTNLDAHNEKNIELDKWLNENNINL